jgi:UDP-glucose 4-epimerase
MNILITGCNGFMGSYLIPALLDKGYDVIGVDVKGSFENGNLGDSLNKITPIEADITDYSTLEKIDIPVVDYVHHLAAIASPNTCTSKPKLAYDVNVHGTFNVLRFAMHRDVKKLLFTSSAHVYGISPRYVPTPEIQPAWLQEDVYTSTKILGEYMVRLFYENYSLPYTSIRLFNSYGPRQTIDYFVTAKIQEALTTGKIHLYGRRVKKDFVYITDVIDGYVRLLESNYVGEINIGSGVSTSLEMVAKFIAKTLKADLSFADDKASTFMQCDTSRAKKVLGWEAKVPLEDGLLKTIESLRKPLEIVK